MAVRSHGKWKAIQASFDEKKAVLVSTGLRPVAGDDKAELLSALPVLSALAVTCHEHRQQIG
jgi:hypothetical protein